MKSLFRAIRQWKARRYYERERLSLIGVNLYTIRIAEYALWGKALEADNLTNRIHEIAKQRACSKFNLSPMEWNP